MAVAATVTGRRYVEQRDTAAILAGSDAREQRFTRALAPRPRRPRRRALAPGGGRGRLASRACPSCPRSRRSAASWPRRSRAAARRAGGPRPALVPAARARRALRDAVEGRRVERARPAREVPRLGPGGRRLPPAAPAHDRARCCSTRPPRAAATSACASPSTAGRRPALLRPAALRDGRAGVGVAALDAFLGARLGLEPLCGELTGARLRGLAAGGAAPVKAFLLDQRHVAGVGNIYADEALFRARDPSAAPGGAR